MKVKRLCFLTLVMLAINIVIMFGFVGPETLAADKKIKIGLVHSMSGGGAMYGLAAQHGAQIAIEEINSKGGILGLQIELLVRDDKLRPKTGAREAKDLYLNENVVAVFGTVSSSVAAAISAYAKEAKKLFIVQAATSPLLTVQNGHRYIFRFAANLTNLVIPAAEACAKRWGDKKVIYIGPDYEYGHTLRDIFWENYKKYIPNAVLVDSLWPPLSTKDYTPYISRIMNSEAGLVASSLYGGGSLTFIKQAGPMGLFKKFHYYNGADGDTEVMKAIKPGEPAPIGGIGVARYPYWVPISKASKQFAQKYQKVTDSIPPYGAINSYIIIYALKETIEKAGVVETEKIINALEGATFDSALGQIKVRKCDHQAMMPCWVGITDFSKNLGFPHVTKLNEFDNPYRIYTSCKKVIELRT